MAGTEIIGAGILTLVLVVFGFTTWQQAVRLCWELKARGSGITTQGRVVGARTVCDANNVDQTTYYRIRFTTLEGRMVELEDELTGGGAPQGGAVIITYHPDQPQFAAVTSYSGLPSWVIRMRIVAVMTPLTLAAAVLLAAVVIPA